MSPCMDSTLAEVKGNKILRNTLKRAREHISWGLDATLTVRSLWKMKTSAGSRFQRPPGSKQLANTPSNSRKYLSDIFIPEF